MYNPQNDGVVFFKTMGSISQNDAYTFWGVFTPLCFLLWVLSSLWVLGRRFCSFWVGVLFVSLLFFARSCCLFACFFHFFVVGLYFFLDSVWWFWFCAYFCSAHLMCRDRVFGRVPPRGRLSLASFFYLFQNLFVFEIEEYPFIKFPANFCQRFVIGNVMWRKFKDYRICSLFFKGFTGIYNPQNDGGGWFFQHDGFHFTKRRVYFLRGFLSLFFCVCLILFFCSFSSFFRGFVWWLLFCVYFCC